HLGPDDQERARAAATSAAARNARMRTTGQGTLAAARASRYPVATSTQTRSVLHHPTQQIAERVPRLGGNFGHQRRRRHAWLRIDLQPYNFAVFRMAVVIPEIGPGHAATTNRLMSLEG